MSDQIETQTEDSENEATATDELSLLKQRAKMMGVPFSNNIRLETLRERVRAKIEGEEVDTNTSTDEASENPDELGEDELNDDGVAATHLSTETAPAPVARIFDAPDPRTVPHTPDQPIATPRVDQTQAPASQGETRPAVDTNSPEFKAALAAALAAQAKPDPFDHDGDGRPGGSLRRDGSSAPQAMTPPVEPNRRLTKAEQTAALRKKIHDESMALIRVRITNLDPKKKDLQGEIFTVANEFIGTVRKYIPYGEITDEGFHIEKILYDQLEDRKFQQIRTIKDPRTGTTRPETRWVKEFSLEVLPQLTEEELRRLATAQMAAGSMDEFAS